MGIACSTDPLPSGTPNATPNATPNSTPNSTPTKTPKQVNFTLTTSACGSSGNGVDQISITFSNISGGYSNYYERNETWYASSAEAIAGTFSGAPFLAGGTATYFGVPFGTWYVAMRDFFNPSNVTVKSFTNNCVTQTPTVTRTPTQTPPITYNKYYVEVHTCGQCEYGNSFIGGLGSYVTFANFTPTIGKFYLQSSGFQDYSYKILNYFSAGSSGDLICGTTPYDSCYDACGQPIPSQTPAATPASTPAPTPSPAVGLCYTYELDGTVNQDNYGITYTDPNVGASQSVKFNMILGMDAGSVTIFKICSTVDPTLLDYTINPPSPTGVGYVNGITKSGGSTICSSSFDCQNPPPPITYCYNEDGVDYAFSTMGDCEAAAGQNICGECVG